MKPRCNGERPGVFLSGFQCCLDQDHDGRCKPYQPPTVDEWRAMVARLSIALASASQGCAPLSPAESEVLILNRWRGLMARFSEADDAPGLDAQVIAAVQRGRER